MSRLIIGIVTAVLLMTAPVAADQDAIASARDLYASAAYEDALAVLNGLPNVNRPAAETRTIEQYRAFCLLALGRTAEADHEIEALIAAEPSYRPSADVSPRVRAAFADVRKRVLPNIIEQQYLQAKAIYDRKEFANAAIAFAHVLEMMTDPDVAPIVGKPPLSDLRTLAVGFKDLAINATPPPPLPTKPAVPTRAAVQAPVEPPPQPRVYTASEPLVTQPQVIRQDLPSYPGVVPIARQGMIEVVIDENGLVETAMMRISVSSTYDKLALAAVRSWRYRPAMLNGIPVKYRKAVQVTIQPTPGAR